MNIKVILDPAIRSLSMEIRGKLAVSQSGSNGNGQGNHLSPKEHLN